MHRSRQPMRRRRVCPSQCDEEATQQDLDEAQKSEQGLLRSRPALLQRSNPSYVPQQERQVRSGRLNLIPLENVLAPAQRRPPRAPVIEHVHETPLAQLPAPAHQRPAAAAPRRPLRSAQRAPRRRRQLF